MRSKYDMMPIAEAHLDKYLKQLVCGTELEDFFNTASTVVYIYLTLRLFRDLFSRIISWASCF